MTHRLYQILVAPVEEHWLQHCIIIPDGVLNYLSFGSLLSVLPLKEEVPGHWKYLEQKYVFSYNYSATLRSQMEQKEEGHNNRLLALAPTFEAEDTLFSPLYFNQPEIEAILDFYPGKNLSGFDATYTSWEAEAKRFEILHLATHAVVNERNPDLSFLAFSRDDQNRHALYLHELYGLDLPAEMITLSACKTNVGPFQTGEGIASLAKGCSYAGARTMVTSLWEVQDLATKKIMSNFYRYLAEGNRKDVAMTMAKRAYLKDAEGLLAHPFYWSAFVVIGSTDPIPPASRFSSESILIISLLVILVIGLILYISKKK
jgi:CHAT domain-containing protein